MAKKVQTPETDILVESKGKIETFFDKFGNKLMWGLVAVTVIAVGIFIWYNYSESKQEELNLNAQTEFIELQNQQMMDIAADDATYAASYVAIAEKYEGATVVPMCYYMAGVLYLQAGDLDSAKANLDKVTEIEGDYGQLINATVLKLQGDIAVEQKDYQTAVSYFEDALEVSANADIYGDVAIKLGLTYEALGEGNKAQEVYEKAIEEYPSLQNVMAEFIK